MKKLLALVTAFAAMLAFASTASATLTNPIGSAVTATGRLSFRGNILGTTCNAALSGTVTSRTTGNITRATFSSCGSFAQIIVLGNLATTPWVKTITLSPRAFTIRGVNIRITAPFVDCLYSGTINGTYAPSSATVLTVTGHAFTLVSNPLGTCSPNPTLTGSFNSNLATV